MRPLWLTLLRASGRGRLLLVVGSTAVATGLLLVAVSIARLPSTMSSYGSRQELPEQQNLIAPMADPGTRGGAVLGAALLAVPLLLLLDQAVRLGSSDRERRYAALAVAGATRADRHRWGAVEVGLPAAGGAVLGVVVWLVLRLVLGSGLSSSGMALVPTDTGPGWWGVGVVAVLAILGVVIGVRQGGREAAVLPAAVLLRRPPRAWPVLFLVVAVASLVFGASDAGNELYFLGALVLVVVGLIGLSPWLAHATARVLARRVRTAASLLAVRRLAADPRPAGRAAAAVGAIGLVGGVLGPFAIDVFDSNPSDAAYYLGPAALVAVCAFVALLVVCGTLAVHSTETILLRRRQMAGLVAIGVEPSVIGESQRAEALMATVPLALLGSVLGGLGYGFLAGGGLGVLAGLASILITAGAVFLAASMTTKLMRPWVADAVRPVHLRTE